jgi:hypothetical protein
VDLHLLLLAGFTGAPKFLRFALSLCPDLGWIAGFPCYTDGCRIAPCCREHYRN